MRLEGKAAVVTGGTSGIGLGVAELFVREGASVVVGAGREAAGQEIVGQLGQRARFLRTDVTSDQQVAALVAEAVSAFGRPDIMVNNAGTKGDTSSILAIEPDGDDATMVLRSRAVLSGHQHEARQFVAPGTGGSIVTVASGASVQGGWSTVTYTAAKHAAPGVWFARPRHNSGTPASGATLRSPDRC